MKNKYCIYTFVIFLSYIFLFLDSYADNTNNYHVISYQGDVQYKFKKDMTWQSVRVGHTFDDDVSIRIPQKCYITLFDKKEDQYIVIHGERTIKLKEIKSSSSPAQNKSVLNILSKLFTEFSDFFSNSVIDFQKKPKQRDGISQTGKLLAICPKKCKVLSNNITFRWSRNEDNSRYRFVLYSENFAVLFDTIINQNLLEFRKTGKSFNRGEEYIWQVVPENGKSEYKELNIFKVVEDSIKNSLFLNIESLDKLVGTSKDANYYILRGLLYEKNQFYSEALDDYLSAIKLNPSEQRYKELVNRLFDTLKINLTYSQIFNN